MSFGLKINDPASLNMSEDEYWRTLNIKDVQSVTFTCEILPKLWSLYENFSGSLRLLDVGTRTGAGTALIGYLHQKYSLNRIKIEISSIDIDQSYIDYAKIHYPFANFRKGDVFKEESKSYDIVLCSHVIEHVDNPQAFLSELKRVAKAYVILACPYEESNLISGHRNVLDEGFFSLTGASKVDVYRSVTWHQSQACIAIYDVR